MIVIFKKHITDLKTPLLYIAKFERNQFSCLDTIRLEIGRDYRSQNIRRAVFKKEKIVRRTVSQKENRMLKNASQLL